MGLSQTFFNFFQKKFLRAGSESTQVKGGSASYLMRVKSKLGLGQGPSLAVVEAQTQTAAQHNFH